MNRSTLILALIWALAGACRGDGPGVSDASTGTTSQTGGSTSVPTTGGDSASVTSSPATSTSEGSSEASGDNTSFESADCGEAVFVPPVPMPSVMLVLDKSGSMVVEPGGFWDHDKDPNTPAITRWNSVVSAVEQVLEQFGNSMYLGAALFPSTLATASYSEAACVVSDAPEVPLAPMNAATILGAIPGPLTDATMMHGATPTTRGLELAIQGLADGPLDRPRIVILVTDGAANCQANAPDTSTLLEVYDDKVEETVAAALAMGIHTYVVGIDITQAISGAEIDGAPDNVDTHEKLNALALSETRRPGALDLRGTLLLTAQNPQTAASTTVRYRIAAHFVGAEGGTALTRLDMQDTE